MLSFALPLALWLSLSILPAALFYFLRLRFRKQATGSLYLWRQASKDSSHGQRWKLKSILLFLLQVGVLVAVSLAAAGPVLGTERKAVSGLVYLLDASASMATREEGPSGPTSRWRLALETLGKELEVLEPDTDVAVFVCAGDAFFPQASMAGMPSWKARDRLSILAGLAGREPQATAFREEAVAASIGAWLARTGGSWKARILSDGGLDLQGRKLAVLFPAGISQSVIGTAPVNVGLQALRPAASAGGSLDLTVVNQGPDGRTVELVLEHSDVVLSKKSLVLAAGVNQVSLGLSVADQDGTGFLADFSGSSELALTPVLEPGLYRCYLENHEDSLALDDKVFFSSVPARKILVLHVGPKNPFIEAAMSWPSIELHHAETWQSPPRGLSWDLVIGDGTGIPSGTNQLCLNVLPESSSASWGPAVQGPMASVESDHPLARWVDWQETVVASGRTLLPPAGSRILARVGDRTLMAAWEEKGQRVVVCGTDLFRSSMGLSGAFPVFLRNLILWSVPQADNPLAETLEAGQLVWRSEGPDWTLGPGPVTLVRGRGTLLGLSGTAVGTARWSQGERQGLIAVNPARSESLNATATIPGLELGSSQASTELPSLMRTESGLTFVPLLAALAFLVAEWFLWFGLPTWLLPAWIQNLVAPGKSAKKTGPASQKTIKALFYLRLSALALLVLALFGFTVPVPGNQQNLVVLFDLSSSMDPSLLVQARDRAREYISGLEAGDRAAIITFASRARPLSALLPPDECLESLELMPLSAGEEAGTTDLAAALALAESMLEGQAGKSSVLLLSDGRPTAGGSLGSLSNEVFPWPVYSLALGQPGRGLEVGELNAPGLGHEGERRILPWTVSSREARDLLVQTRVDGGPVINQQVRLEPGDTVLPIAVQAGPTGLHRVEVNLADMDGRPLKETARATMLEVGGPPRILLVDNQKGSSALKTALEIQGMEVDRIPSSQMPDSLAAYQGIRMVILDNIPALDMGEKQQSSLISQVSSGGGLLVLGGDQSLGRGEYYATALEGILPVRTDERQRLLFTRNRLLFVLDHSGSMGDMVGKLSKLQVAMNGIDQAIGKLSQLDEVGILTFDTAATWQLPFTPVSDRARIDGALRSIPDGGGTDMTSAMEELSEAFARPGPLRRHVIILTDGQTASDMGRFEELASGLRGLGVSISTIGIGDDINEELLEQLATWGKGTFYRAKADEVPRILTRDTMNVTRELMQEGFFSPQVLRSGGPLVGIEEAVPALGGYLVSTPRQEASVWLAIDRPAPEGSATPGASIKDPLLATWRYGNGTVAVFTADSGRRWLSAWSGKAVYNRFFSQLVRYLEQARPDQGLQVAVRSGAGQADITVDALDAGRRLDSGLHLIASDGSNQVLLTETAPGHYQAQVALPAEGLSAWTVRDAGSGRSASAWSWNGNVAEDPGLGADLAGLGRLSEVSGGFLVPRGEMVPLPRPVGFWDLPLAWPLTVLAILVFLVELGRRSTMHGQVGLAKNSLGQWWKKQMATLDRYRNPGEVAEAPAPVAEGQRKVMDAYRYMALHRSKADLSGSAEDRILDADRLTQKHSRKRRNKP